MSWFIWLAIVALTAAEYGMTAHQARKTRAALTKTQPAESPAATQADSKPADKPVEDLEMVRATHD